MWAVLVRVEVPDDLDDPRTALQRDVVPVAKSAPGFVRGIWAQHEQRASGFGLLVFDDEQHARAVGEMMEVGGQAGAGATVTAVDVYEVLAEA